MNWANREPAPFVVQPYRAPPLDQSLVQCRILRPFWLGDRVCEAGAVELLPRWLVDDLPGRVEILG